MSAGHGATLRGVRTIPTFVVSITVLLAASALVMSPAGAAGLPRGGVIEVTGYKLVAVVDSSGPVTAEAKGEEAKAIRIALSNLPTIATLPLCVDEPDPFTVGFEPHAGENERSTYSAIAGGCPTPGVVIIRSGKSRPTILKEDCALERAVLAVLPTGRAKGTRRYLATALHEPDCVETHAPDSTTSTTIVSLKVAPPATGSTLMEFGRCQASALRLEAAPVSEKTEQHSLLLAITNDGTTSCSLLGYPGITLYDSQGGQLPLTYQWKGDQMVTSSPPQAVNLAVGAMGYVLINKNVCVGSEGAVASALHFIPPGDTTSITIDLPIGGLTSCQTGWDPGSTLEISPIEPTASATFASSS